MYKVTCESVRSNMFVFSSILKTVEFSRIPSVEDEEVEQV